MPRVRGGSEEIIMESQAYKVGIESACSGAWPVIYEVCYDPDTHEE